MTGLGGRDLLLELAMASVSALDFSAISFLASARPAGRRAVERLQGGVAGVLLDLRATSRAIRCRRAGFLVPRFEPLAASAA